MTLKKLLSEKSDGLIHAHASLANPAAPPKSPAPCGLSGLRRVAFEWAKVTCVDCLTLAGDKKHVAARAKKFKTFARIGQGLK